MQLPQVPDSLSSAPQPLDPAAIPRPPQLPIRRHLEQWQQQFGGPTEEILSAFENHPARHDIYNRLSKLSPAPNAFRKTRTSEWDGEEEDDGEDPITIGLFLKPGDVVELTQADREPFLAVFVQQIDHLSQFFSVDGRWCHSTLVKVAFAIPGCIDPSHLQRLIPFLPTSPETANTKGEVHVPPDLAAPVRQTLEDMTKEAERIYRTNASVLDSAYATLADPARVRMMTLTQIAKRLLAGIDPAWTPSAAALLAVRKALHHNEFRFLSDNRSHRLTNVFAIRSKNDVHMVETVHEWIREYFEHLAVSANPSRDQSRKLGKGASHIIDFIEKSRRLIATSRKDRDPNNGTLGPSKVYDEATKDSSSLQLAWGETFTSTDQQIINFLQAWVLQNQFNGMSGLTSASLSLILATNCYEPGTIKNIDPQYAKNLVGRSTGMLFLQEIGVLMPYENRSVYDEHLMLSTVRPSRNLEVLYTKAELIRRTPDFRDSVANSRRDWASTTVFCIDAVGAQEIDDGISIERIDGQTSEFWIHVHVANPTAFFDKTHTLSGLAAHMTETVYTPERAYPMLPAWATQGYFSLDRNRPVLTFSSRINSAGGILETRIQHGIIRNVVSLTPSEVAEALGDQTPVVMQTLVVGGDVPRTETQRSPAAVPPDQLQDLQDLYLAAQILWKQRRGIGQVQFNSLSVRVFETARHAGISWMPPSTERARWTRGDPIIEVTNTMPRGTIQLEISPRNIVEEMMILACRTAAAWCAERHIPVMYRGTIKTPDGDGSTSMQLEEQLRLYQQRELQPPRDLLFRYIRTRGKALAHFAPIPHKILGVPGYVKVTSPLRRFSDMITHWQIEAALRYESQSGKMFNAYDPPTTPRDVLPFSQRQVQDAIITLSPRERLINMTSQMSKQRWATLAFLRAFFYRQASLPKVFKFWVDSTPTASTGLYSGARGILIDYGLQARLIDGETAQVGDEWEVKLDNVDVFAATIHVRAVRLLTRSSCRDV